MPRTTAPAPAAIGVVTPAAAMRNAENSGGSKSDTTSNTAPTTAPATART